MNGLNKLIGKLAVLLLLALPGCTYSNKEGDIKTVNSEVLMPNQTSLRAIDEDAIRYHDQYGYYLLYLEHSPRKLSYAFSLRLQDTVLYSYTKYIDNIVSASYPPMHYLENNDSIFYTSRYQEHEMKVLDTLRHLAAKAKFRGIISDEKSFERQHNSRWLIIYDTWGHSIYNWMSDDVINQTIVKYIRDSLMQYNPNYEQTFHRRGKEFKNHIPQF